MFHALNCYAAGDEEGGKRNTSTRFSMFLMSAGTSDGNGPRVLRTSKRGGNNPSSCGPESDQTASAPSKDNRGAEALSKERRISLNSKQTLQLLHRAAATEKLRTAEPARRLHGDRLYGGPTARTASSWEARFDSPGPQAYNEGDKWQAKFRKVPSARIDVAKCARHAQVPTKPGPGDYNIAHHSVGDNPVGIKFGSLAPGKRHPPRTPDQPRAKIPCSYAEPEHVSCLHQQSTSNRSTSPTVFFGGAPRFQERPTSRGVSLERSPASTSIPKSCPKKAPNAPTTRPVTADVHTSSAGSSRRGQKRKKRRRGGPRIFRRGDYGWLSSCVDSKPWEPKLKLLDSRNGCDANEHRDRTSTCTLDASRSRSLTEKNAPRPVLRRGERCNQSEYNPQHRDLPREKDRYPGPKYDPPPGAFGRTGGSGGSTAPSASVSSLDRFPRGRLFSEEEVQDREATPGPEAYDVGLEHRLEGHSLEIMQGSVMTLGSWSRLGVDPAEDWPFAGSSGSDGAPAATAFSRGGKVRDIGSSETRDKKKRGNSPKRAQNGQEEEMGSETELMEGVAKRTIFGRSRTPCFAGDSAAPEDLRASQRRAPTTTNTPANEINSNHRTAERHCSRLSPASSAAARRGVPCSECLGFEVANAVGSFVAAAASVSDANLFRRARKTGASVRFGDFPRQRSAPAFSIGRGQRDVASRLLHTTQAETIYREARLGRSGKGPTTADPRAGDVLTRPRPAAARVILPNTRGGSSGLLRSGHGRSRVEAAAGEEADENGLVVVDGALGPQVKSYRPTSPSFTLAGPRRAATLFHERLRYGGRVLSVEQERQTQPREFFDAHIPTTPTVNSAK